MTDTASTILDRLRMVGATMSIADGNIVIDAPEGAVGGELLVCIKAHKVDLLDLLDERDRWPEGRPWWLNRIMVGPVARPDVGTPGYREHLARIQAAAAAKAEPAKTEAGESLVPDAANQTRPGGGPDQVVDTASMAEKIVPESP